jgi:hypothetical protein
LRKAVPETVACEDFLILRNYISVIIQPVVPRSNGYEAAWTFTTDARPEIDITIGIPLRNIMPFNILGYLFFPRIMLGARKIRISSTMLERFNLHAYSLPDALQHLIGWKE